MNDPSECKPGSGPAQMVLGIVALASIVGAAAVTAVIVAKRRQESNPAHWMTKCDQVASKLADKLKIYDVAS